MVAEDETVYQAPGVPKVMLRGALLRCECSVGIINLDGLERVKSGNVTFTDIEGEHAERTQQRRQQLFDAATQPYHEHS